MAKANQNTPERRRGLIGCLARLVRKFLKLWCGQYKWARKIVGGRWEEWWADAGVNAYVWLHEPPYLDGKRRPGGCAIWEEEPHPRKIEIYSANVKVYHGVEAEP